MLIARTKLETHITLMSEVWRTLPDGAGWIELGGERCKLYLNQWFRFFQGIVRLRHTEARYFRSFDPLFSRSKTRHG